MAELLPMRRYVSKGTPLNPQEIEVLHNLIEEAGEVIKAACKILRFGAEDTSPTTGASNTYEFGLELGALHAMIDLSVAAKLLLESDFKEGRRIKLEKLAVYSQYLP